MFLTPLRSEFISGTDNIVLTAPLVYKCPRTKTLYTVPTSFISDGASIPKILWPILGHPFDHRWRKESVLHDWFYRKTTHAVPRKEADQIFYDGLRGRGLGYFKGQSMYMGVRIGGRSAWNKNRLSL